MCRRKIFIVVVMLIITVLDAAPRRVKKRRITTEVSTTKKYVTTYTSKRAEDITLVPTNKEEVDLPAAITPTDNPTARNDVILHKSHKKDNDKELLVKPLEIDGVVINGINNWFILDGNEPHTEVIDEECYKYYEEYRKDLREELIYVYDVDI